MSTKIQFRGCEEGSRTSPQNDSGRKRSGVGGLEGNKSCVRNRETGRKTRIEHEGGQRAMYWWAPSDRNIKNEEANKVLKGSKFAILGTEKEETKKDFTRRV